MSDNPSLAPAMAAKAELEKVGWTCKGRARVHKPSDGILQIGTRTMSGMVVQLAAVLASRGDELLSLTWADGECLEQKYSLWAEETTPVKNDNMPARIWAQRGALGFNPDELSDGELVKRLNGVKVHWWNKLGQTEESAVIAPMNKGVISIYHYYTLKGQEIQDGRSIQFIDAHGGGFKAFRLASLFKVGS